MIKLFAVISLYLSPWASSTCMISAMNSYQTILYDHSSPSIACITLNRPEKRNPINPQVNGELIAALTQAQQDSNITAIILTGAGKVFSAGGDLSMMSQGNPQESTIKPASLVTLLQTMHHLGKPIIAKVNGHALAGGLGLMVACDLVIASDQATFGTTEINVGLWPMMITAEITRNIGRKKTLELMLTGKRIDAAEAMAIGLINQAVPLEELDETTMDLAQKIASKSPAVLKKGLLAFYKTQDMDLDDALKHLETELTAVLALEDAREGLMAFFQKRSPKWKGC